MKNLILLSFLFVLFLTSCGSKQDKVISSEKKAFKKEYVQKMNDPSSYEFVEATIADTSKYGYCTTYLTYRVKNGFGALTTHIAEIRYYMIESSNAPKGTIFVVNPDK